MSTGLVVAISVALGGLAAAAPTAKAPLKISAADPLAAARAAIAEGKDARALLAAPVEAPGLLGTVLERAGDAAGACALYAKDRASTRAPAAALRHARCLEKAGDAPGAIAAYAEVGASPLGEDPLVIAEVAVFLEKHDLPVGVLEKAVAMPVGTFDDARREALAQTLRIVALHGSSAAAAAAVERLVVALPETAASRALQTQPEAATLLAARPKEDLAAVVRRANALADRHESDAVVALLAPLVVDKDVSAPACEARLLMGKAYRKLRKYGAAKKQLDAVARRCTDDVKKKGAYLSARVAWVSKTASAAALLQGFADAWPTDPLSDDVLLWLGDVKERGHDAKAAQAAWQKILESFPDGDMVHEARFRLAWSRAGSGDVDGAREVLDEAARAAGARVDVSDRALYWRARLALAPQLQNLDVTSDVKRRDAALAELVAFANSRPAGWYGHLARLLVTSVAQAQKLPAPPLLKPAQLRTSADAASLSPSAALAADPRLRLAIEVLAGGYDDEARLILGNIAGTPSAPLAPEDRFALALLAARAGDAGFGHALLRDGGLALLPGLPSTESALAWSLDWPRAHLSAIAAAAAEQKIPTALLSGLAREESAFDADVVSWAGAVGLCQLMMPTAADEAVSLKLPVPSVDDLKDPMLNARLGASHIARRLRGLKHPSLAIAAYNAGPGAVMQWNPHGPVDAFVEQIPVDETRNYVKKVTGSWVTYSVLDGSVDDVTFPLVL